MYCLHLLLLWRFPMRLCTLCTDWKRQLFIVLSIGDFLTRRYMNFPFHPLLGYIHTHFVESISNFVVDNFDIDSINALIVWTRCLMTKLHLIFYIKYYAMLNTSQFQHWASVRSKSELIKIKFIMINSRIEIEWTKRVWMHP